jgi:hypothetical protein
MGLQKPPSSACEPTRAHWAVSNRRPYQLSDQQYEKNKHERKIGESRWKVRERDDRGKRFNFELTIHESNRNRRLIAHENRLKKRRKK